MAQESTISILEELREILTEEKEALIKQETKIFIEMGKRKEELVFRLERLKIEEKDRASIHSLAKEIKDLQEINNMLIELSMEYNQNFLDAFQAEAQKNNTYSKLGKLKQRGSSGILNQSL